MTPNRAGRVLALSCWLPLALSGAAGTAGGDAPAKTITADDARRAVDEIVPTIEEIRALEFREPVQVDVVDDATAREHALRRLGMFYDDDQILAQQTAYIELGLLPEGTDVREQFLEVIEEQAGGFYDPGTKTFFLLDDMPAGVGPMLAAHELTHALEDQYFDLDARLEEALPDDDRAFAVSAVYEGSAMLVMSLWTGQALAAGTLTQADLQALAESDAGRGDKLAAMPPALRRPFLAAYVLGMAFLTRGDLASLASGFPVDDVNASSEAGPRSSEQILHPEKFWDPEQRDDPTPIEPFDARGVLGKRWKRAASGTLGELVIGVMVDAPSPAGIDAVPEASAWTNDAAAGWDGDRWELWRRKDSTVALLATVWDSPDDALEFEQALTPVPGMSVKRRGDRVALVAGAARAETQALLDLLLG